MEVMELGMVIEERLEQFWKAKPPINVTESGMETEAKE